MPVVFFETKSGAAYSEKVATFETEELFIACLPILEKEAEKERYQVTESMCSETYSNEAKKDLESHGYYTENMFNVNDVKTVFNCTDEQAKDVLKKVLDNPTLKALINESIVTVGELKGLTKKTK